MKTQQKSHEKIRPFKKTRTLSPHVEGGNATTVDDYIEHQSSLVTPNDLRNLSGFSCGISNKALQAVTEGRYGMVLHIDILKKAILRIPTRREREAVPRSCEEAVIALGYLIKGVDLIPDFIKGIGLDDDEVILRRVVERNTDLRSHMWSPR